jgi:hypothetical protein
MGSISNTYQGNFICWFTKKNLDLEANLKTSKFFSEFSRWHFQFHSVSKANQSKLIYLALSQS